MLAYAQQIVVIVIAFTALLYALVITFIMAYVSIKYSNLKKRYGMYDKEQVQSIKNLGSYILTDEMNLILKYRTLSENDQMTINNFIQEKAGK